MKKLFLLTLVITSFFALASVAYSADETLTPERLSGIWEGTFIYQDPQLARSGYKSKLLITQNLNGAFLYYTYSSTRLRILDGQGEIINNQLLMRDRATEQIKVNMNCK